MHNERNSVRDYTPEFRILEFYCDGALVVWDSIDIYSRKYRVTRKRSARFASALWTPPRIGLLEARITSLQPDTQKRIYKHVLWQIVVGSCYSDRSLHNTLFVVQVWYILQCEAHPSKSNSSPVRSSKISIATCCLSFACFNFIAGRPALPAMILSGILKPPLFCFATFLFPAEADS